MARILGVLAIILIVLVIVLVWLSRVDPDIDLPLELAKSIFNLIVAILVTGALSFVLAQHNRRQAQREERARVLSSALQELKSGYDKIEVARFFLSARPSPRTLADQIGAVAEARSRLHRVQRERFVLATEVESHVQQMLDYLAGIAEEYRVNYLTIADDALAEERVRRRVINGDSGTLGQAPLLSAEQFPRIAELIDDDGWKQGPFHRAYNDAKLMLQTWLDEALGRKRTRRS